MDYQADIRQRTVIAHKTGKQYKEIVVGDDIDDSSQGVIDLKDGETFYENDLELLQFVLNKVREGNIDYIMKIMDYIWENRTGIYIEGTWYSWEQIKPVFEKVQYFV